MTTKDRQPAAVVAPAAAATAARAAADEVRWLSPSELEAWMMVVSLFNRLPNLLDRQLQRDAGLTHFEYQVLAGLSAAPDRTLRMSALAAFTDSQLPRLSQVAARLEKRGWVRRQPDAADRRNTLATITAVGLAKLDEAAPGHVGEVRRLLFDKLTQTQVRQLREIGRRITPVADARATAASE